VIINFKKLLNNFQIMNKVISKLPKNLKIYYRKMDNFMIKSKITKIRFKTCSKKISFLINKLTRKPKNRKFL